MIILPICCMAPSLMSRIFVVTGFVVAAIGGYTSFADTIGLKPFDRTSYEKVRKTYESKGDDDISRS